jgi:hypothetical protein
VVCQDVNNCRSDTTYAVILPGMNSALEARDESGGIVIPIIAVPYSHKLAVSSVCSVCLFIAWLAVLLRFYTRAFINRALGYDDLFMLITIVCMASHWNKFNTDIQCAAFLHNILFVCYDNCFTCRWKELFLRQADG